jgi:hypothetical protein
MAKKNKHQPRRTCIVCRGVVAKRDLTRIVRTPEGNVERDPHGKRAGRGAYLCDDPACWQKALSTPILERALRTSLSPAEREALTEYAQKHHTNTHEH